jgi:hypothetical protein
MEARMNLKQMNDEGLLNKTDVLVREERELLTTILHHFREIERRRLFSALGYKSLFDMAVRRFGYGEDQNKKPRRPENAASDLSLRLPVPPSPEQFGGELGAAAKSVVQVSLLKLIIGCRAPKVAGIRQHPRIVCCY